MYPRDRRSGLARLTSESTALMEIGAVMALRRQLLYLVPEGDGHPVMLIPGFTATDNYDGDIRTSVVVSGSVDENTIGSYELRYNVSDSSGNPAPEQVRTVNVIDITPFAFTEIVGITETIFQLTWESRPGDNFVIWTSTDLLSGWVEELMMGSQGETTTWIDPSAGGRMKFYKIERQ